MHTSTHHTSTQLHADPPTSAPSLPRRTQQTDRQPHAMGRRTVLLAAAAASAAAGLLGTQQGGGLAEAFVVVPTPVGSRPSPSSLTQQRRASTVVKTWVDTKVRPSVCVCGCVGAAPAPLPRSPAHPPPPPEKQTGGHRGARGPVGLLRALLAAGRAPPLEPLAPLRRLPRPGLWGGGVAGFDHREREGVSCCCVETPPCLIEILRFDVGGARVGVDARVARRAGRVESAQHHRGCVCRDWWGQAVVMCILFVGCCRVTPRSHMIHKPTRNQNPPTRLQPQSTGSASSGSLSRGCPIRASSPSRRRRRA